MFTAQIFAEVDGKRAFCLRCDLDWDGQTVVPYRVAISDENTTWWDVVEDRDDFVVRFWFIALTRIHSTEVWS